MNVYCFNESQSGILLSSLMFIGQKLRSPYVVEIVEKLEQKKPIDLLDKIVMRGSVEMMKSFLKAVPIEIARAAAGEAKLGDIEEIFKVVEEVLELLKIEKIKVD